MEGSAEVSQTAARGVSARADQQRGIPDLLYGEQETELRSAVRALLEDRCSWRDVLARIETSEPYDAALWRGRPPPPGRPRPFGPPPHPGAGARPPRAAGVPPGPRPPPGPPPPPPPPP